MGKQRVQLGDICLGVELVMNLRVAIALAFSVVSSLAAAGLDTIASGLVNAPAVSLHPSLDVTRLATAPDDLVGPRAFLADAVKNRRKLDTVIDRKSVV